MIVLRIQKSDGTIIEATGELSEIISIIRSSASIYQIVIVEDSDFNSSNPPRGGEETIH